MSLRVLFGLMMVFVYVGMGLLILLNFFGWSSELACRLVGSLLILYGIFRGYRHIKGKDYNKNRQQ
ncbi:MAG: hypothetical protein SPJ71_03575 [Candidatus Limisoma sp.]|nr:hypothetical protein [Bacteroidales bacterium]MDY4942505.1 hypothetical protein [Candidatus Limisoma sp.]MDY5893643.1 hypothetical protein [Candidatus Limisoma sp.]MDY5999460.1 hypothetical protein [Candidatus Limisoma sp.]MDY6106819.1 hypothetical protein [Candidatus Limisoma sp.]